MVENPSLAAKGALVRAGAAAPRRDGTGRRGPGSAGGAGWERGGGTPGGTGWDRERDGGPRWEREEGPGKTGRPVGPRGDVRRDGDGVLGGVGMGGSVGGGPR